jgi:hypothetical protein
LSLNAGVEQRFRNNLLVRCWGAFFPNDSPKNAEELLKNTFSYSALFA